MSRLTEHEQALLAGGEAPLWLRLKARLRANDADHAAIASFRRLREAMPVARELPEHFAWPGIAAEMKANILLGVEAGEVVRPRLLPVTVGWRAGLAMALLSLLVVAGYWWRMPHPFPPQPTGAQPVLEASRGEMGFEHEETGFVFMVDEQSARPLVNGSLGAMRTDYVDQETGQLTVAHVYVD